jgi:hypothetical protein
LLRTWDKAVDSAQPNHQELTLGVLREGRNVWSALDQSDHIGGVFGVEGTHATAAEVAEYEPALKIGESITAVNKAANDGAITLTLRVVGNRRLKVPPLADRVALAAIGALEDVPAIISTRLYPIDFFPGGLADVADPELTGLAIKAHTPRIAKPEGEDLPSSAITPVEEWVVVRDAIAFAGYVKTQDLSTKQVQELPVPVGFFSPDRRSHTEVEVAIGAELQSPSKVGRGRAIYFEQSFLVSCSAAFVDEPGQHATGAVDCVVHVETAAFHEIRRDRQAQEPCFVVFAVHAVTQVGHDARFNIGPLGDKKYLPLFFRDQVIARLAGEWVEIKGLAKLEARESGLQPDFSRRHERRDGDVAGVGVDLIGNHRFDNAFLGEADRALSRDLPCRSEGRL